MIRLRETWHGPVATALLFALVACSGDKVNDDSSDAGSTGGGAGSSGSAGFGGGSGIGGSSGSGPDGPCWPSASCGVGPGRECVAWHDNTASSTWTFRLSELELTKPDVLAGIFFQQNVVSKNMSLNMPACFQEGTGRWSWLLSLDTSTHIALTGAAHVQPDVTQGYCFINSDVEGLLVQPADVPLEMAGQTTFRFGQPIATINTPIFLTDDESNAIVLPLHQVVMEGTISADRNCIGRWAGDELEEMNNCKPDHSLDQKSQWIPAAGLTGYIFVEEADTVWIPEMAQTLCVALSGSAATYGEDFVDGDKEGKRCKRVGGQILAAERADWCSATNSACSPPQADSFRFEGAFAASAVEILDNCP